MMRSPLDWSTRTKAFALVAVALVLWAPQGVSTEQLPIVTGHSTFFDGDTYDRCLASVAGLLRSRVMWFNDMVLAEHYGGKGTFVYITEQGAPDPTEMEFLYSEGVFFDFVDPNGAHWHVEEAFIGTAGRVTTPGLNLNDLNNPAADMGSVGAVSPEGRTYVWFVELSERPISDQFAPPYGNANYHDLYNFLVLVDTCKFNRDGGARLANASHTGSEWGHPAGEDSHEHESWNANIWIGTRPVVLPVGASEQTVGWQSQWAASGGPERSAGYAANATRDDAAATRDSAESNAPSP
jgi:hypothetical protein